MISTYRIKNTNQKKFLARLKKVSVHELGHNLGLKHCKSDKCLMRDAEETIKTVDYVDLILCDKCKQRIK
ncbi:MAG: matrixin family metalloprotease [Chloroflexia bacterium]|nr:matrixin family metalloprotease [Chloroflexia bacterium]